MLTVDISRRVGTFQLRPRFAVGNEVLVLFGHSGSGKSQTLHAIAGLLKPDSGSILVDGEPVFDARRGIDVPPQRRGVGYVVQHYALFPHLTVAENIAFGLHGMSRERRASRVDELVELLGLQEFKRRRPPQLSGGQQQRVALARALAPHPRLLLLDEPFSALDSALRTDLRREFRRLKRDLGITVIFVTHDLQEAYNLADRIAVFDEGEVLQVGQRDDVFRHPLNRRAATLMDVRNIICGHVSGVGEDELLVETAGFVVRTPPYPFAVGAPVDICIRPERLILTRPNGGRHTDVEGEPRNTLLYGEIVDEIAHGAQHTLFFRADGSASPAGTHDLEVEIAAHPHQVLNVAGTRRWAVSVTREDVHVMAR